MPLRRFVMNASLKNSPSKPVITTEQVQKRVAEMARQISDDYCGKTILAVGVLENSFVFMADLIRNMDVPVVCRFIKPKYTPVPGTVSDMVEIFFSEHPEMAGQHVLLVEGLVHSGITTEFLVTGTLARGAASVKVATLLDRQSARRVQLQPDYFGFLVDESFLVGYGLGASEQTERNLPYLTVSHALPVT